MELVDRIRELSSQASRQLEHISSEEATKISFVMPFIQALGYNVFDPREVVPEYIADVGTKKGEKVDYAVIQDGKPIILIEVKSATSNLNEEHASQLFRYFAVTEARIGILTNGLEYRFHSDLEKPNHMDEKPFLIVDILNFDPRPIGQLKKFCKTAFDVDRIVSSAKQLKYKREIRLLLESEYNNPSEDFVRHFTRPVYSGRLRESVVSEFTEIVKQAFHEFLNDKIATRLQTAIESTSGNEGEIGEEDVDDANRSESSNAIITSPEELESYFIVKSILRETVDPARITIRDLRSYCGILLDNNNRKPLCRLHFNRSVKYVSFFPAGEEKRVRVDTVDDIFQYADHLISAAIHY